jgi:hypothetical protein
MADALQVYDGDESVLIATASASSIGQTAIRLWEWKAPKKSKASNGRTRSIAGAFEWLLKAVVVMAATAYFVNVIREHLTSSCILQLRRMIIGNQIRNHGVDSPHISG